MAEITAISYAFIGFLPEQEAILSAYFANADKWDPPWALTEKPEDAHVVIAYLSSAEDYGAIETLKQDLPRAEVVAFSPEKPPQSEWHLERLPTGKVPIVAFSKQVLKLSHSLKRKKTGANKPKPNTHPITDEPKPLPIAEHEDLVQEPADMSSFFNQLDSILDSKPNEKRKRFNEK